MLGLALQGGGAKGAFQAGAIKALFEEGYSFDGVVGASIGAMNGALIAQGDFEKTYELWYNMEISQLFDIDDKIAEDITNMTISGETVKYFFRKIKEVITERGLDRARGRELLLSYLDEDKIRASKIEYGLVTIEKNENKFIPLRLFKEDIPNGLLIDYIIASGNLPIFRDLKVDGKTLLDGGFYDNLPINMLIEKGYKDIVAIRLGDTFAPVKEVTDKSVRITYIDPSEKPGSLLNFTNKSIRKAIILGYYDTKRILNGYLGKKYYIYPVKEKDFYGFLSNLSWKFQEQCAIILEISLPDNIEGATKIIIGEIRRLMKLDEKASDLDCVINYIEAFAEYSRIERFKFYTLKELLDKTVKAYKKKIDFTDYRSNKRLEKLKAIFDAFIKYY